MPNFLGMLIQLLQQLNNSNYGGLANIILIISTFLFLLYYVAFVLFDPKVISLFKTIRSLFNASKPIISEAFSSPYSMNLADNIIFIKFSIFLFYMYALSAFMFSILFFGVFLGFAIEGELAFTKKLLALIFALLLFLFSWHCKCKGDKELFKIKNKKST